MIDDAEEARLREALKAAQDDSARMRLMADNVPVLIAYYEREGYICRYANLQYASTFGLDPQSIVGRRLEDIIGSEALRFIMPHIEVVIGERRTVSYERELAAAGGVPRCIHVNLLPHLGAGGDAIGAFVLISDITRYRVAEARLRESELRMSKFMQASVEGIAFHKGGRVVDVNAPIVALTGYSAEEMIGRDVFDFVAPDFHAQVRGVMERGEEVTHEVDILARDGSRLPVEFIVRTMERDGERLRMTIVRDIRDRRAAQARIHHLAHHDALTGLANRRSFMERLDQLLTQRAERGGAMALLFIDLDHFKRINDSLGHLAGDSLLQQVARRISQGLRGSDLVGRFGGDEFVVLLPAVADRRQVHEVSQKLLASIAMPLDVGGHEVSVTPSIGIALCPRDGQVPGELVRNADLAMYYAKASGRAACRFFDPSMRTHGAGALAQELQLARALQRQEFALWWAPRRRLADGAVVQVQAQPRWRHPERGWLTPERFAAGEPSRLMPSIAEWALQEVRRRCAAWAASGAALPAVALDFADMPLAPAAWLDVLGAAGAGGPPGLTLEWSARQLAQDESASERLLQRAAEAGLAVALHDLGGGALPLTRLGALPLAAYSLAPATIAGLPGDERLATVVRALLAMAAGLQRPVVALGVSSAAQRDWLAAAGCALAQGDAVGPALEGEAFAAWWRSQPPAAATASSP